LVFANFWEFIIISIIYVVVILAASSTILLKFILGGPLTVGIYYVIFQKMRGHPMNIGDISKGFNFFIAAMLADILISFFVWVGFIFLIAVWLVKPIGVSTQYIILDGILCNIVSPGMVQENPEAKSGYSSANAYLNKSGGKYAKNIAKPFNYGFIFVISILIGAFISAKTKGPQPTEPDLVAPKVWRDKMGQSAGKRYLIVFLAGFLVLFGARLAGGCTSGHLMSGIMQTSLSGYLFALFAFAAATPVAIYFYQSKEKE
jgi:hypothetical protein